MLRDIIKKIAYCFKTKFICVDFFQGRLKAVELGRGVYIDRSIEEIRNEIPDKKKYKEVKEGLLMEKYYNNIHVINYFSDMLIKHVKFYIKGFKVNIFLPYEKKDFIDEWYAKVFFYSRMPFLFIEAIPLDNFTCIYNGFDIPIENEQGEYIKNIVFFIYDHTVYVGFAFVGYVFVIRPIEKKAEDLSSDDILLIIKELLENTSEDVHKRFDQLTNKKKEYKKIISGWKKPFQNTIYLFSKEDLKKQYHVDGYKIKFFKYDENDITTGMEKIMAIERKIRRIIFK
ncbi:MAG: hypothetical protein GX387_03690 [Clostridium sp.]|jgi:hypothetical protein|nr:hypothetical protein [Clostridium sp.]